jgi:hypothetical protein
VLFSAIHYKGLEDGPDFQFAFSVGSPSYWRDLVKDKNKEPTEEEKRRAKWRLLMDELGIHGCDEFEALVVEFLESGLFDDSKLSSIVDRYVSEKQNVDARDKCNQFLFKLFWDYHLNDAQLLELASEIPAISGLLDPYMVTELDTELTKIPGGAKIGQEIVDEWIAVFKSKNLDRINDDNLFNRPLHAAIVAEFDAINNQSQARTTVLDACMHVIENSGWGTMQQVAMKSATASDFESAIRNMDIDKLKRFMRRMIEMRIQRQTYDPHFGTATDRFVEACRSISNDNTSSRLAGLIERLFTGAGLAFELASPQVQDAHVPTTASSTVENNL